MKRVAESMNLEDLKVFEKAFRTKAEEMLPLSPQLAAVQGRKHQDGSKHQAFKI